jgi:hypothetical protein
MKSAKLIKAAVRNRDSHKCVDCGRERKADEAQFQVHRKVPGSEYTMDGCVTLCPECHGPKPKRPAGSFVPKFPSYAFRCSDALRLAAGQRADEMNIPLGELIAKVLAEYIGQPELGRIERKKLGRPRLPIFGPWQEPEFGPWQDTAFYKDT